MYSGQGIEGHHVLLVWRTAGRDDLHISTTRSRLVVLSVAVQDSLRTWRREAVSAAAALGREVVTLLAQVSHGSLRITDVKLTCLFLLAWSEVSYCKQTLDGQNTILIDISQFFYVYLISGACSWINIALGLGTSYAKSQFYSLCLIFSLPLCFACGGVVLSFKKIYLSIFA